MLEAVAGSVVIYFRGVVPFYITVVGAILGISYSGKPLRLGYYGYGELLIGLMFGPLLMIGVQYAACGVLDGRIVLVGIAVGLLVTNILYSHSVLDAQADAQMEKLTLARLLKGRNAVLAASAVFNFVPFLLIIAGVAVFLWRSLRRFVNGLPEEIVLKKWFGPMSNFPAYREAGIDWFMYRWLMARNLISFFALILLLVNVVLKIAA